jgi:hypothetical protein
MTNIETLKLQQENLALKIEILGLRSRVNELTIGIVRAGLDEIGKQIAKAEADAAEKAEFDKRLAEADGVKKAFAEEEAAPVEAVKAGLNDPEE